MSLTPYQQQSNVLAANCEVAERQALVLAEAYSKDYTLAKKEYQLSHDRFTTRTPCPAPPDPSTIITAQTLREDIRYYTSCPEPNMNSYYNEDGTATTRSIDKELKERARARQKDDLDRARRHANAAAHSGSKKDGSALTERLAQLAEDEYGDLLQIEATQFRRLAKDYYDTFYGKFDSVLTGERDSRRTLEDVKLSLDLLALSQLRDRIHHSEELLMIRAMGLYPLQLLRNDRARQAEAAEERARQEEMSRVLDSMVAVPLWQRVLAIRAETEAEEETIYRVMMLAHVSEADFVERNLGRHNMEKGGVFEIRRAGAVPHIFDDSLSYICAAERLFCELGEETGRMAVIDEALQGWADIHDAAANPAPDEAM